MQRGLDRFELGEMVGEGAFARVYRAVDRSSGCAVALKRLDPHADVHDAASRFVQEAELLARIDHPRVVRYVAHGTDEDGGHWLALEWLDGCDLAERQRARPLSARDAVSAMAQALSGLSALHDAGIVHRDIKPANFFLVDDGSPTISLKLLDLGVARTVEDLDSINTLRIGTPAYMSPEQAAASPRVGPASDLYAVGVVLFELLTGQRPHESDDAMALLAKIVLEPARKLRALLPEAPMELEDLLKRALAKRPADRPPSATAMASELSAIDLADLHGRGPRGRDSDRPTAAVYTTGEGPSESRARIVTGLFARLPTQRGDLVDAIGAEHGALVHRLMAKRVVLLFGARRALGDEPLRAARAALALREALPDAQLALVTGRALTRSEGLSGDVVDRGIRVLDEADAGSIRLDEASARQVGSHFYIVRDAYGPVLGTERPLSTVAEPRLLGQGTPVLDRERQISALLDLVDEAVTTNVARAAVVIGEPGIGKSRVRYELLRALDDPERSTRSIRLVLRGDPTLARTPLGVVSQALRHRAGVRPGQAPELQRQVARELVDGLGLGGSADVIMELLGVGDPASPKLRSLRTTDSGMARALQNAVLAVLERWLERAPVMLVVEDLQWVDARSVDVLGRVLSQLSTRPLCLFAFARPEALERFPALFAEASAARIELHPLSRDAARELVRGSLGDQAPEDVVASIVARAGGNPLFLEELIRAASEGRGDDLPLAVQAAFQVRIDELPEPARDALLAASVAGRVTWREALVAQLAPGTQIDLILDVLRQWEVLIERPAARFERTRELAIRHALLRDVAYAMLPRELRREHHLALARWLEEAGEDDATLAHHFEEGGDGERAAELYRSAASRALGEGAPALALEHAERGLSTAPAPSELAHLRNVAARACHRLGRYDDAVDHARRGLAASADPDATLLLGSALALTVSRRGATGEALAAVEDVLARASDGAAIESLAEAESMRAWALYNGGRPDDARRHARALLDRIDRGRPELCATELSALHCLARALHDLGELDESLALHREVVGRGDAEGHHWRAEGARHGLGLALITLGRTDEAIEELERARDNGRRFGMPSTEGYAQLHLAIAYSERGQHDEQLAAAASALEIAERIGAAPLAAGGRVLMGEARVRVDPAAARELAQRAEADSAAAPAWWPAARALAARALLDAEPQAARRLAEEARDALQTAEDTPQSRRIAERLIESVLGTA